MCIRDRFRAPEAPEPMDIARMIKQLEYIELSAGAINIPTKLVNIDSDITLGFKREKYAFSLKASPLSNCCLFTSRINVVCDNIMPPPITLFQVILQIGEMVEEMIKSILKYLRPHPMDYLHTVHFS